MVAAARSKAMLKQAQLSHRRHREAIRKFEDDHLEPRTADVTKALNLLLEARDKAEPWFEYIRADIDGRILSGSDDGYYSINQLRLD